MRVLDNMVAGLVAGKTGSGCGGDVLERVARFEGNGGCTKKRTSAGENGEAGPRAPDAAEAARIFAALSRPRAYHRQLLQQLAPPLRTPASLEEEEGEEDEDLDDDEEDEDEDEDDDDDDDDGEEGEEEEEEEEEDDPPGFSVPLQGNFLTVDYLTSIRRQAIGSCRSAGSAPRRSASRRTAVVAAEVAVVEREERKESEENNLPSLDLKLFLFCFSKVLHLLFFFPCKCKFEPRLGLLSHSTR